MDNELDALERQPVADGVSQSELIRRWAAKHWQWRGRQLAYPHVIMRRLTVWPLLKIAQCIVVALVAAGWGIDDAKRAWHDMC